MSGKNITESYRPCTCAIPGSAPEIYLGCGCRKCSWCDGYTHWAHPDSL